MNKIFSFCLISFLSLLLFTACSREAEDNISGDTNLSSGGLVSCTLKYNVADMAAGTAESKALTRIDDDQDGIVSDIENILVVQFNGAEESSTVSRVDYISNLLDPDIMLLEADVKTIILFIANTFDGDCVSVGQTLATVKSLGLSLSGNMATTTNGIIYDESLVRTDDDGEKYFMFSDCKIFDYGIQSGEDIEINLQRNVAKITLNVSNGWEAQMLTSINICSIPKTHLYYSNCQNESDEEYPLVPSSVGSTTTYSNTIESVGSIDNPVETTLSFYVPVNMRGYDASSTDKTKPKSSCASGATYAKIGFDYDYVNSDGDNVDGKVYYSLYLGADLSCDFNLRPNTFYAYNITFYGMGDDVENDARISIVESIDGVDYTSKKSSNCYILNPSDNASVSYHIPIAPRVNEYWGADYGNNPNYYIEDGDIENWEYKVLWYDNADNPYTTLTDVELTNTQLSIEKEVVNGVASLKITLGAGFDNMGNVLVAVTKGDVIIWSWHLWITDYNPYDHGLTDLTAGSHELINGSGALHRYADSATSTTAYWGSGGIYEDKYIMDRNIGARSAGISSASQAGHLYYQFGRKDPFPYSSTKVNNPAVGISSITSSIPMSTAVVNPTSKYSYSSNWCNEYTGDSYLWHDTKITGTACDNGEKSIFDPSPYGFRLPISKVWNGMTLNSVPYTGSKGSTSGYGLYFTDRYGNQFLYPACGYMTNTTTSYGVSNVNDYTIYISATVANDKSTSTHVYSICKSLLDSTQGYITRSSASSLRSIEDVAEVTYD